MDWRAKALLQGVFSRVPFGERLNYLFQRHVTRGLPMKAAQAAEAFERARRHLVAIQAHHPSPVASSVFYEFGAGWNLAVPLSLWALGVDRQVLVDIEAHARVDVVNHTIGLFRELAVDMPRRPARPLARIEDLTGYGIEYRAPCDARATGLPAGAVDVVTSTFTLEHIPPPDVAGILRECHRCLADDGVASFLVDYQDHYSFFDRRISAYNFLRFSDRAWALYNPSLHYQSRLRHRDYLALFAEAGFEVLAEEPCRPTVEDLAAIATLPLARRFSGYTPEELGVRYASVILRKRAGGARPGRLEARDRRRRSLQPAAAGAQADARLQLESEHVDARRRYRHATRGPCCCAQKTVRPAPQRPTAGGSGPGGAVSSSAGPANVTWPSAVRGSGATRKGVSPPTT